MRDFVHLHVHSEYSLLDGAARISDLAAKSSALGMKAVAITDHGVMYGVVDFYKACKEHGIKPIIGCEVYVAPRKLDGREGRQDKDYAHFILLAKDDEGYSNLVKLCSMGFLQGFYYKPRIDYDVLEQHSAGLIGLSACLSGDIPRLVLANRMDDALDMAKRLKRIFAPGDFYIELQDHGFVEQKQVNLGLIEIAKTAGLPLVATNDVHYINRDDAEAQDVLMCIQTGKFVDETDRMKIESDQLYLKSGDEMAELFSHVPGALDNSLAIADKCNVEFDFTKHYLPGFEVPESEDNEAYLRRLCMDGLNRIYGEPSKKVIERLDYELGVINSMGFTNYFLIVWDFIKYAKDNGIVVGPGRGSAAGSLCAYALGITGIDPIKYDLLFERFLNPERISMPDIDIDFCADRRQEVIDYVVEKYGSDHVAQIITFGTMAARAVIRDVGRVLRVPYGEVDRIAKMVPQELNVTIEKALSKNAELRELYESDYSVGKLIDLARKLEGLPRHASTHAAGVVIAAKPLTEHVPVQKNDEVITTQFTMKVLESIGLLKMDFLGLRNLTAIRDAVEMIEKNRGIKIDIDALDLSDQKVYDMIGEGDTDGVFQLESGGMRAFLRELKPDCFEDIIAGISLFRPGPMDQIPRYVECKRNPESVRYDHPLQEHILKNTYGCMVYQEQVMQIVRDMAGYSLGRSDLVRRAMSKKNHEVMERERRTFIYGDGKDVPGAVKMGVDERVANSIFDQMMDFASYAFNRSHAAAYGVISYQTAWLKRYYPAEFMAATINSYLGSSDKAAQYLQFCRSSGIPVLQSDVNKSGAYFEVQDGGVRFGLAAIKNVGVMAVLKLIEERKKSGPYKDFFDFCRRTYDFFNKRMVESMIKAGCFDSMGHKRSVLSASYERILDGIGNEKKKIIDGQISLFGGLEGMEDPTMELDDIPEFPSKVALAMEKEVTGMYISAHPLLEYTDKLESFSINTVNLKEDASYDGQTVVMGGLISSRKDKLTRNDDMMSILTLEDLYGVIEVVAFPKVFRRHRAYLEPGNVVSVKGRVSMRDDVASLHLDDIEALDGFKPDAVTGKLVVKLFESGEQQEKVQRVMDVAGYFNGGVPLCIYMQKNGRWLMRPDAASVDACGALVQELGYIAGQANVRMLD
ncbi:MAG: DNA polymerase III subunit alpha [Christensenellales bacterium]|jgi:DNA polymerase-3 subunit alpha